MHVPNAWLVGRRVSLTSHESATATGISSNDFAIKVDNSRNHSRVFKASKHSFHRGYANLKTWLPECRQRNGQQTCVFNIIKPDHPYIVIHLAQGLKNTIMFLNPARIVIGDGISRAGDASFVPLRQELGRQMAAWSKVRIDVVPASLGGDSVLRGARELARERVKAGSAL